MIDTAFKKWCSMVGLKIKKHQMDGIKWCYERECAEKYKGGIISDEMGLGKTILMLGCIMLNKKGKTLIVVPPALLGQWKKCIEKFLFGYEAFVYHGQNTKISIEELEKERIVLTTYGMIAKRKPKGYKSPLWKPHWGRLIFDEAHHLRNFKTSICNGAFKLTADVKWMVTGTPIQNKKSDIRILFGLLGRIVRGEKDLKECISRYLLRRTKKGVGINIPNIITENVVVKWESEAEKNLAASIHMPLGFSSVTIENVNEIMKHLEYDSPLPLFVRARQSCIHSKMLKNCIKKMKNDGLVPMNFKMKKISTSSKISAVVEKVISEPKNKRKIVFCHYREEIDELKSRFQRKGYSVSVMDGRSKRKERLSAVQRPFGDLLNIPKKIKQKINQFLCPDILIAQIQSASEGLNLQHFSQIYFPSPHWNPAVEDQAIARAHRIGQKNKVKVVRFQMEAFGDDELTLENYCIIVQEKKRELMKLID